MAKPEFDPNKSFAPVVAQNADKPAFDPNKPFAPVAEPEAEMSDIDAAKIGVEQGATLGLRPVVAGLAGAVGNISGQLADKMSGQGNTFYWSGPGDAFSEARRDANAEQKKAAADHPYISGGSQLAGGLLTAPLIGVGSGLKGAMRAGAGFGAANAVGSAESLPDAAEKVGEGLVGGAAGYGLAETGGALASKGLTSFGESKAFKAAGAMLKDFRTAFNKEPDKINELGRTMLDTGLVKAGDSVSSIAQKAEALRRQTGQKIGQVYDKVMGALTDPASNIAPEAAIAIQEAGFHPEQQAETMKQLVAEKFKGVPGSTGAINKANQVIDELAANGNNITPDHALELKGHIDSMINWSKKSQDLPLEQDALKEVRGFIQDRLNTQVASLDQALGSSQSGELVRLNKLYGNVATIANISKDRVLRESANQSFGLGDKMSGGLGAVIGLGAATMGHGEGGLAPVILGGAGVLANKAARTYGNSVVAESADKLGRAVVNPASYTPGIMQATARSSPMSTTIRTRDSLQNTLTKK